MPIVDGGCTDAVLPGEIPILGVPLCFLQESNELPFGVGRGLEANTKAARASIEWSRLGVGCGEAC